MSAFVPTIFANISAQADQFGLQFAACGADHDVKKADLDIAWDPGLKWRQIGAYHFTLVAEPHASYWNIRESQAVNFRIWEFGIAPVFRFIKSSGWFLLILKLPMVYVCFRMSARQTTEAYPRLSSSLIWLASAHSPTPIRTIRWGFVSSIYQMST